MTFRRHILCVTCVEKNVESRRLQSLSHSEHYWTGTCLAIFK